MNSEIIKKAQMFHAINDMAIKGEIAIFGSTFAANFPFYEMSQDYVMSNAIYNRSISDITLKDAVEIVQQCVVDIKPQKVFLCFGENETDSPEALPNYRKLIYKLKEKLPYCKIYVISIKEYDDVCVNFNKRLSELTLKENVNFLKIDYADKGGNCEYKNVFKKLTRFFRGNTIDFSDAFIMASK